MRGEEGQVEGRKGLINKWNGTLLQEVVMVATQLVLR